MKDSFPKLSVAPHVHKTMKDIVLCELREGILSGELEPEQELNIKELCEKYNVSRTPIREAINYLESMGLVEVVNHKHVRVAKFLSDEAHETYWLRASLSELGCRLATKNMSQEEKQRLVDIVSESVVLLENKDLDGFLELNNVFHSTIAEQIKTSYIRNLGEHLYVITRRYRTLGVAARNEYQLIEEHADIAKAIFDGDEEKAGYFGRIHYLNTIDFLQSARSEKEK